MTLLGRIFLGSSLATLCLLTACASRYSGEEPDFSKTGAEQVKEVRKFELNESFMGQGLSFLMGPRNDAYTLGSVTQLIKKVSPEGYALTQRGQLIYGLSMLGAVGLLGTALVARQNHHRSLAWVSAGTGLLLASYGGISLRLANQEAARKFNKDIHKKFVPLAAYEKKF